ncbi:MAG: NUDIX hydrolase [Chroococcidiopsidaceae cyanobacterium CP_BM_RX_35]|nr:NUDIX hydrolase [Chroococcidiopsidaceae cyanobacterium CP_BM_RX_35]
MSRKASRTFKQSGVIPYRLNKGKIEVLLVTSRKSKNWVIPKGGISKAMTPPSSAAKEAWEEAGVTGQVDDIQLGTYKDHKQGKTYRVKVFLLPVETVLEDWPEASQRQRQWLNITQAARQVKKASLKRILKTSAHQIQSTQI